jgi:hypothetical protein
MHRLVPLAAAVLLTAGAAHAGQASISLQHRSTVEVPTAGSPLLVTGSCAGSNIRTMKVENGVGRREMFFDIPCEGGKWSKSVVNPRTPQGWSKKGTWLNIWIWAGPAGSTFDDFKTVKVVAKG